LDFKVGGIFHYKMEKNGKVNFGRFIFGRIERYDLLEFTNAFSDEHGNIVRAPFDIQLPIQIFYRLKFAEKKGKTTITMTGQPVKATKVEEETFRSINPSMQQGFEATFNQLAAYLNKVQTGF
ncbi:MAG: polyketide cyclase, partial [Marivirga sp.]|nr:polyketide cyclase [Marivirga sp.]